MEAFTLLKFWRISPPSDRSAGYDNTTTASTTTAGAASAALDPDEEDSFFDLDFDVPGPYGEEKKNSKDANINSFDSDEEDVDHDLAKTDGEVRSGFVESPNDVFYKDGESSSKPLSPISFLRSPPKFRVFMLFRKPKLEKPEAASDALPSPPSPKQPHQQSKRFGAKCKVEEVPIFSLLSRANSSRSKLQRQSSDDASSKRFSKDAVQKYLKLINIKPLYVRVSKRYTDKLKLSDDFATSSPTSSPATSAPLRAGSKHLGKSRSASSASGVLPPPARRDDSLQLQHDGIQSAILHCKRSYNSRDFCVLSRSSSHPSRETDLSQYRSSSHQEDKKRSSI
ncbi:probable membrane-associated kinase regulator 2 [Diospyros lotus]|uniref:probable membrane-associated kinase regulator 2 n=1 Tax=Diospyros lotus TaxID=55363 RepID=UPI0022523E5F|nr:probable membrane-associated kinase regulator 2 [Diospyros lotus]